MELFDVEPVRDVAVQEKDLMVMALESGKVEMLERLIAMRNLEQERGARINFESAFGRMKADLPIIKKTKEVKRMGGQHMYNYAPLEEIQKVCDPILQRHGFCYSWREEAIEGGKRIWYDLMGYGHTKSNFFDAPLIGAKMSNSGGEITNAVQGARMTSSYAKRASMVDGLGMIIEDEDDDASTLEIDDALRAMLTKIELAHSVDELIAENKKAMEAYSTSLNARTFILGTYAIARKRLQGGPQ